MSQQSAIDTFFVARKRRFCGDDIAAAKKRVCLDTSVKPTKSTTLQKITVDSATRSKSARFVKDSVRKQTRSRVPPGQQSLHVLAGWNGRKSAGGSGDASSVLEQDIAGDHETKSRRCQLETHQPTDSVAALPISGSTCSQPSIANKAETAQSSVTVQRRLFADDDDDEKKKKTDDARATFATSAAPKTSPTSSRDSLMSPQKMKASLSSCSKIQQLRERLAGFNQASEKLKAFGLRASECPVTPTRLSSTVEFDICSPQKTPKKILMSPSPVKSPSVRQCMRLMDTTPHSLTLPFKFRQLKEMFHCVDTCASFLHNRKEIITMRKLRPSVQQMLGRSFREHHLAQICTVFPAAFHLSRDRNIPNHTNTPNSKHLWQLVVRVNMDYDSVTSSCEKHRQLTPQRLLQRARIFSIALLDLVRQQHSEFLASLDPPVTPPAISELKRWHAEFPLEEVADVVAAQLPEIPDNQQPASASAVLERASQLLAPYPALASSLQQVASARAAATATEAPPVTETNSDDAQVSAPAASSTRLPSGLLARIRAREAARAARDMTRSRADEERRVTLGALPALARSMRAIFIAEQRGALRQQLLLERLCSGAAAGDRSMAGGQLLDQLKVLAAEVPDFVQLVTLKSGDYVKLDRNCRLNDVIERLQKKYREI